jgi:DNA-binding CsgD family transcriptional regulator
VLLLVDDVQWVDASSRECVEYVARRAGGSLGVVLAARDPGYDPERVRLPGLPLAPLDDAGAGELLRERAPALAPPVAAAVVEAAAGNPLALLELPETLTADERSGVTPLDMPLRPGKRLGHAFASRISPLDPLARRALLIAATHPDGDLATIAAACDVAATDAARLAEAEATGLVRLDTHHATFVHPLARGAVCTAARAADRRAAHRALGQVLRDERRIWHLAAAAIGPDERIAAQLDQLGSRSAARRAYAAASAAFERAADLAADPASVSRRLRAAGEAAGAAGAPDRALALIQRAAGAATDPSDRGVLEHLRGRMLVWRGQAEEGVRVLTEEADRIAPRDPARAASVLADAANGAVTFRAYLLGEELARRSAALLGDGGDPATRAAVLTILGWVLTLRGRQPEARPVVAEAVALASGLDPLGEHWPWLHILLRVQIPLGGFERARQEADALCLRAREAGALAVLGGAAAVAADAAFRLGDWESADEAVHEAIRVCADTRQPALEGLAWITWARLAAARGRFAEGYAAAQSARDLAGRLGITSGLRFTHAALGFLELGRGRIDEAIAELEEAERLVGGSGLDEPTMAPWAPDLIEAYVRQGRTGDARRVLATLSRQALTSDSVVARADAARCRGVLDDDFDPPFAQALALHQQRPMPFERARTLLAYGRRLRRAHRVGEACARLREALRGFEELGAEPWAEQARQELRLAGARRRRPGDGSLTGQELRVASAVRRGASNREIAAELFVSPKTVEFHLRQIYRKLDVRSRTQLCAALAGHDEA